MEANEESLKAKDLNQQGIVLLMAGNVDAALNQFNKAIDVDPMVAESYKNLGDLNFKTGNFQEAKNYYKKALLIEKNGEVYFQYGNVCFMNDEPHEGLEYYNLALTAKYDNDEMFFFMGLAYEHMNDDKMALRYIQKAIAKNPSRPDYKVKKVSVLLRLNLLDEKNYSEAVDFSKNASNRFPEDPDLLYDYANATALSGACDAGLKIIDQAKKLKYFDDARARFALLEAEINAELGNIDEAIAKCDECISLETEGDFFADARFMRLNLALTVPDFEGALENANKLVEQDKDNSYYFAALYFRPYCLNKLERKEEAVQYFKEAISLYRMATLQNPEAVDAYLYRAMCLKDMAQYEEALELLEFMENLSNEIAEVYTIRSDIYKLTGKGSLVKEELEKAFKIKPELRAIFGEGGE